MDWLTKRQENECLHLEEKLEAEKRSMNMLLREHHLINGNSENVDRFVEEYIFLFEELYCGYQCVDSDKCEQARNLRAVTLKEKYGFDIKPKSLCTPDSPMQDRCMHRELDVSQGLIIKAHLDNFKYLKHIANVSKAREAFSQRYFNELRALLCTMLCPDAMYCREGVKHLNYLRPRIYRINLLKN